MRGTRQKGSKRSLPLLAYFEMRWESDDESPAVRLESALKHLDECLSPGFRFQREAALGLRELPRRSKALELASGGIDVVITRAASLRSRDKYKDT